MYRAYCRIFKRCGLPYVAVKADSGVMGGGDSHEFMVPAKTGEDEIVNCKCGYAASRDVQKGEMCPQCKARLNVTHAIELGHTFKLGTKYSAVLGANFLDKDGKTKPMIMGCYGIGIARILAASIELNNDKNGIIWPAQVAPYEIAILPLNVSDEKLLKFSEKLYDRLRKAGLDCILDDRQERAGVKFKDADLIGFPTQVIIGEKNLADGKVEIKDRKTKKIDLVNTSDVIKHLTK